MKILFCTPYSYFEPGGSESYDYFTGIQSLGHSVKPFFYRKKSFFYSNFRRLWIRWMNRTLLEEAREVDLVFVFRGGYIEADTLRRIREAGATPCVCFFGDNPYGSNSPPLDFNKIAAYNLFVTKDTYFYEELRTFGFDNVVFLPHSYDPAFYEKPLDEKPDSRYTADVAFIGGHYDYREHFFSGITDEGVDFKIWGPRWNVASDPWVKRRVAESRGIYGDEKLRIIRSSKIFLNLINGGNSVYCPDDKPIICLGAGGFVITNHKKDIDRVFQTGEEIITFRSKEELRELIRKYLADDAARLEIARRGQERARRDHTTTVRFGQILGALRERGISLPEN